MYIVNVSVSEPSSTGLPLGGYIGIGVGAVFIILVVISLIFCGTYVLVCMYICVINILRSGTICYGRLYIVILGCPKYMYMYMYIRTCIYVHCIMACTYMYVY